MIYLTCSDTEKKNSNEKMREFLFLPSVACASFFKYMYFLPGLLIPFTLFFFQLEVKSTTLSLIWHMHV